MKDDSRGYSDSTAETDSEILPAGVRQYGSVEPHVFSHPARAAHWRQIYKDAGYEGRHRFDPTFQWTASEEKQVKRKLDYLVMAWVWVMFSSLDLVRRNMTRAVSDNLLDDIGVTTNDYNIANTIYLVCFLAAELPGGLISKKVGPFRYTPTVMMIWGGLCMAQAAMHARWSLWLLRALLGMAQGGFIPEMVLFLSYFYKGDELPVRLSVFWTAIPLTQTYGSLLAGGFLAMRGIQNWAGWQWLFLLEGLLSVVIGLFSFFLMPPSITEPARAFRRPDGTNKWWTEREEKILVNRLLRDDPTKGDLNNRVAVTLQGIWEAAKNYDLWPMYILGIAVFIPYQPTANYLSLILRNMGYSVFLSNVLAIPGYILFAANIVILGRVSEYFNERLLIASWSNIWMLPFFIALVCLPSDASPWVRYVLLTGINGIPYAHSILVGMTSHNAKSVGARTVSAALYNISYQIGSIVASNIYQNSDKPLYHRGNRGLLALCCINIVLFILAKLYYIWRNRVLTRHQANLPPSEKSRSVDMRFVH